MLIIAALPYLRHLLPDEHAPAHVNIRHLVVLQPAGSREQDIRHLGGGGHKHIGHHGEIHLFKRLGRPDGVGLIKQGIAAHDEESFHGVRLAGLDGFQQVTRVYDGPIEYFVFAASEHLLLYLRCNPFVQRQTLLAVDGMRPDTGGRHQWNITPGHVEIAGDNGKTVHGTGGLESIDILVDGVAPLDTCRPGGGVKPRRRPDFFRGNPGYIRHPFRGIFRHSLSKVFKPHRPFFDEVFIV